MESPYRYKLDPIKTPGYCHVDGLTEESAHVASLILQSNRTAYHVFTTDFDKMGVRMALAYTFTESASDSLDRPTYTITLCTMS